jgi:hypothetical protein
MSDLLPNAAFDTPSLSGPELPIAQAMSGTMPLFLAESRINFARIRSAFAIALHMHQPLIPAGTADGLAAAPVISNLQFMFEHPEIQDAHNAAPFLHCYRRMAELVPQLLSEGKEPRVMLDYSGCLLHGLRRMGADDAMAALRHLASDSACRRCVEWLGTAWGHAVAPSTPPRDFRRHVRAWQHQFAADFGLEALARVRGFSPPEMALPNHPDICYEFVRTLCECGYRWVLVQEHTVEQAEDGGSVRQPHVPHRLIAQNSRGEQVSIIAIIKTQGSDTKLVGQMQPCAEAHGLPLAQLGTKLVPQLVTQIGDGENGGVMMNEFPSAFTQAMRASSGSQTPAMNVTEYLEHLAAAGVGEADFPGVQPLFHKRIFDRLGEGGDPQKLESVIAELRSEDARFHVEGGSWTSDISWVRGYEAVLTPMESASAALAAAERDGVTASDPRHREALFHLLICQTSCFRYWGEGLWADRGRELCRRAIAALNRAPKHLNDRA